MYYHTVLKPVTLSFKRVVVDCPICHAPMEKHIVCEGARFHVISWNNRGTHCSERNCETNHLTKHYNERKGN